jgi:DNA-binding NarL/FixJ family response regulator
MITMTPSILIVDDHPSFRATARALLQSEGYTIVGEAVDGASALAAARELHPEVVLLDVQLPDTDGFAVAAELAQSDDPPAIVLTSSRDASDFGPLIAESGARGFVPKGELCARTLTDVLE